MRRGAPESRGELLAMRRFLPHSLAFLAAHALLVAAVIALG
jgi:hypothetical protein